MWQDSAEAREKSLQARKERMIWEARERARKALLHKQEVQNNTPVDGGDGLLRTKKDLLKV